MRNRLILYAFYTVFALLFWLFDLKVLALLFGVPVALAMGIGFIIFMYQSLRTKK